MAYYESYFTDFTGNVFRIYLDDNGTGVVPHDLRDYLYNRYNIIKHEFISSLQFIYTECAFNIVNYIDSLHPDQLETLNNLYVIGPAYKEPQLTTIDYQANVSGTPFYIGNINFDERDVEPTFDTMRREVKEETFLTLHRPVNNYDLCFLTDTYLPERNNTTRLNVNAEDLNVYGRWADQHGITNMTSSEINDMEQRLLSYKRERDFRQQFNQYKIALVLIGNLSSLYNFYSRDIRNISTPPHISLRSNDFGVVLIPLTLVYKICKQLLPT